MKKVLFVFALGAILASCGGKTACDCQTEGMDLLKETAAAMGDADKLADLQEKSEALTESCKDFKEEDFKDCK